MSARRRSRLTVVAGLLLLPCAVLVGLLVGGLAASGAPDLEIGPPVRITGDGSQRPEPPPGGVVTVVPDAVPPADVAERTQTPGPSPNPTPPSAPTPTPLPTQSSAPTPTPLPTQSPESPAPPAPETEEDPPAPEGEEGGGDRGGGDHEGGDGD